MMIVSLVLAFVFFIIFIFLSISGLNFALKRMIDSVLNNHKEDFTNNDNSIVNPIDDCRKIDVLTDNQLNFQTATNIPLSPVDYKNYVGNIYIPNSKNNENNQLTHGKYCMMKPKLLYDGIWESEIKKENPFEKQDWKLTNGDLTDGYYCSDKMIETNKPIPENYKDESSTPPITDGKYYTWFNDTYDDIFDTQISCFPSVFNAGITEDLKKKFSNTLAHV